MIIQLEAFKLYLESQGMRKNTIDAYMRDIKALSTWLNLQGVQEWNALTSEIFTAFIEGLSALGKSQATITRNIAAIRRFIRFLHDGGVADQLTEIKTVQPKTERKPLLILTKDQIAGLMKAPDQRQETGLRDAIMLKMLYETGIKVTEIISLTIDELDLKRKRVLCQSPYEQRIVYLNQDLVKMLKKYVVLREESASVDEGALFVNCYGQGLSRQGLWKMVKTYAVNTGLPSEVTPHTLRHSFAVHLLQDGGSMRHLQMMMGHQDVTSTQVYAHYIDPAMEMDETSNSIV